MVVFILFSDLGGAMQLMNILRVLIDPENMMTAVAVSVSHLFIILPFSNLLNGNEIKH